MSKQHDQERALLSEAGRRMAAARRVVGIVACAVCGREVVATSAGRPDLKRMYCSQNCKAKAYRQRHADELNARQREQRALQRQGAADPARDSP